MAIFAKLIRFPPRLRRSKRIRSDDLYLAGFFPEGFAAFAFSGRLFLRLPRAPQLANEAGFLQLTENALNLNERFPHQIVAHPARDIFSGDELINVMPRCASFASKRD